VAVFPARSNVSRAPIMRRAARAAGALTLAVVGLAGCIGQDPSPKAASAPATAPPGVTDPAKAPRYATFYDQKVTWKACLGVDGVQCADMIVPLDWNDPAGSTIKIALTRGLSEGKKIASLVFNPGGPGVGARDFVKQYREQIGASLADSFDFVGMDPRGTGASDPIECLTNAEKDRFLPQDTTPDATTSVADVVASAKELGAYCEKRNPTTLAHVDTLSAAKDMDVLRAVLGEQVLTYWGASYGTYLGAWYAQTFPWRVGRFVLDGAVDPSLTLAQYTEGQVEGFDLALRSYLGYCLSQNGCPLRGTLDEALGEMGSLVDGADITPLRSAGGRELTQSLMVTGIVQGLYSEGLWPSLTAALSQAERGDGAGLMALADEYLERSKDGTYSTVVDANAAIYCLDHPETRTLAQISTDAKALAAKYPPLGNETAWSGINCLEWPVKAVLHPQKLAADGAAPILVVGTVGDPATPYRWARSLASQLSSGVLLTYDGEGHTAFRRGNSCIDGVVDAYLIYGTVPKPGKHCPA